MEPIPNFWTATLQTNIMIDSSACRISIVTNPVKSNNWKSKIFINLSSSFKSTIQVCTFMCICRVLSCLYKMLTNCLNRRLVSVRKRNPHTWLSQIGFREGYRASDHIFSLKTFINKYILEKFSGNLYACFIYFKKA